MKKILVSAYFVKNLGDDLFLKILIDRYKDIKWVLETNNVEYKNTVFRKYKNVEILDSFRYKILRKIGHEKVYFNSFDGLIIIGGSIFMESDGWEEKLSLRKKMFEYFKGKSIFILGSNFGPYTSDNFINSYKELFEEATDICFRDEASYKLFKQLKNTRVNPDIVFNLKFNLIDKQKNSLGISLINLEERKKLSQYTDIYIEKIIEIIRAALKKKTNVTLFSFCECEGDVKIINTVMSKFNYEEKKHINIESYSGEIDSFLERLSSMENIIGTRFHSCILSQVFKQGVFPIIYDNKTYNTLRYIKLDKNFCFIDNLNKLNVEEVLRNIDKNILERREVFLNSEKQFEVLDECIK